MSRNPVRTSNYSINPTAGGRGVLKNDVRRAPAAGYAGR